MHMKSLVLSPVAVHGRLASRALSSTWHRRPAPGVAAHRRRLSRSVRAATNMQVVRVAEGRLCFCCVCMQVKKSLWCVVRIAQVECLELTEDNIEKVLDEVRPYLRADGGDVELVEIDGLVVRLRLQGACGSCPSSITTMQMGIQRRLIEKIPDILEVEQVRWGI